jgi:hypothetical protein
MVNEELMKDFTETEDLAYDDEGKVYFDPAGRLRDKDDPGFSLAKMPQDKETVRLQLLSVVNRLLRADNNEMPYAKETYKRLRDAGAGNLEARSLLAAAWAMHMHECVTQQQASNPEDLKKLLDELMPHERDSSGRAKG